ncbi:MAG TPA: bifunctional oligoribonuclease/PAP phosphatase NrnA [Thermodesulfobacteriota bacterium]|nr:bifunctional oligoribonuclease/PAP phosphatase NrnA [Thermodesulfobacteriota bacterium]
MSDLERIVQVIRKGKRFLVTSHENPDGDAIGSMLGLGLALESIGKEVAFYNRDGTPRVLGFLSDSDKIKSSLSSIEGRFDCTFIVDCTDTSRVGMEFQDFVDSGRCGTRVIIDHHQTNKPSADLYLLNPDASSTGMIVYSLLKALSLEITPDIAKSLYTTIVVDTGSFRYSNTNQETFRVAADLVELGADPWEISHAIYESEPLPRLRLLGLVLPTLEVSEDGRIAWVYVSRDMFRATGTTKEDTEGFVNFPRSIKGVEVAVLFREEEADKNGSRWKVSLRSNGRVDVSLIAEGFGGGGHKRAAGCLLTGSLATVKQRLFSSINEALRWTEYLS